MQPVKYFLSPTPRVQKTNGFTLIEAAICILIFGIVIAAAAKPYSLYLQRQALQTTQNNVATITSAIGDYRLLNGYYPCPASLTLPRTDPNYGHPSGDCVAQTIALGSCVSGVCVQAGQRHNITYNSTGASGLPPVVDAIPHVAVGAVPFRELNLDESQMLDGYGHRIFYVVTERLAEPNYFQPDGGVIEVLNAQNTTALGTAGTAQFLTFSVGADGAGGYSLDGTQGTPCPATGLDVTNCSLGPQAIYRSMQKNTQTGANHYDDVMNFFTMSDIPLWQYSTTNTNDIIEKPGGNVGAYLTSQDPVTAKAQIGTAASPAIAHVSTSVMANTLCDGGGSSCFRSSLIAGSGATGGIQCPAGQYLMNITGSSPTGYNCVSEVYAQCSNGQIMTGITAAGIPQCASYAAAPSPCGALTDKICTAGDVSLSASASGTVSTQHAGATAQRTYTCSNGSWTKGAITGSCTCTPSVVITNPSCGTGFTGSKVVTTTTVCPAGTVTVTTNTSACVCTGGTKTTTAVCPAPLTGSYIQTSTLICPAGTYGPYLPSSPPPGACTCTPQTQTTTNNCGGNLSGTWTQTRNLVCPAGTYTAWTPAVAPNGACTCNSSATQSGTDACPPATPVGSGIPWTETLSCPSGTWGPKVYGAPDCQVAPPVICHWYNNSSGSSSTVGIGPSVGSTCGSCNTTGRCSSQLGTNSYINYNGCTCQ